MPGSDFVLMFVFAVLAGTFGALLGLGGGIIIIPVLTILFHVPIKEAVATSLVSVIATSTGAAMVYVRGHRTNVRLGMSLEMATTIGALIGGTIIGYMSDGALALLFTAILLYTAWNMLRSPKGEPGAADETFVPVPGEPTQEELDAHVSNGRVPYVIRNFPAGMGASLAAGMLSGLLGIGGGIIKVPVMRLVMGVPLRVAIATSNYTIGVTAATGALIYFTRGQIDPQITAVTVLGVLLGAQAGTRLSSRVKSAVLVRIFVVVILITAVQMILRAARGV